MKTTFIRFLIHFFFIAISFSLYSQNSGPKTVFWEISGENLKESSYLFGSMHIIPKADFVKYKTADKILTTCDQLVMEMNIDVSLKQKIEWSKLMMLPEGQKISDYVNEEKYSSIKSYALDTLKVKEFMFNTIIKMKPFAFYSALIPYAIGKKIKGYELHFSKIAGKKDIPVYGLESFEFQMGIFDSIPYSRQMEMFFTEEPDLKNEMTEMLNLYFSHDIYEMANSISEENSAYREFEDQLLRLRNSDWAFQLDELMENNSCFITVGAAHLAGENGLIKLLREKGYKVEAICLIPECRN